MATSKIYLVPVDFSRGSLRAFDYALTLSRENKGQLVALNVVPAELIYPPTGGRFDFYSLLDRDARENFKKVAKRKRLKPADCRVRCSAGHRLCRNHRPPGQKAGRHDDCHGQSRKNGLAASSFGKCGGEDTSLRRLSGPHC